MNDLERRLLDVQDNHNRVVLYDLDGTKPLDETLHGLQASGIRVKHEGVRGNSVIPRHCGRPLGTMTVAEKQGRDWELHPQFGPISRILLDQINAIKSGNARGGAYVFRNGVRS